nr:CheR family methyltransferase [Ferrovum sp.]
MVTGRSSEIEAIVRPREFCFTERDFEQVRSLIHERAGISLSENKRELVYSRLTRRLRATGAKSFEDYLRNYLKGGASEWEGFINALTTNLTSFFRESHHFELLAQQLRRLVARSSHPIRLWCSACSTGEEPYSMAMTVLETLGPNPPVLIQATDIDTQVLALAEEGTYVAENLTLSETRLHRFFHKGVGKYSGSVRIRPEVRRLVTFFQLNLLDTHWPLHFPMDAIFCRNVMIYFDKDTQYKILGKMAQRLDPEGLLYAGHSEIFYHARDFFHLRGKTVYQLSPRTASGMINQVEQR